MKTINNWRYVITGVTALALMSFGSLSLAEATPPPEKDCMYEKHDSSHRGGNGRGESSISHLAEVLELTEEQKRTLAEHKDERHKISLEQRKQLHKARRALRKAVADNANEVEIAPLANQVGDLTAMQLVKRAQDRQFLLSILTEAQKEKMAELKSQHKGPPHRKAAHSRAM